jgi:hypothetical protein
MRIALSILLVAIAVMPVASSAATPDEAQQGTDHYNTVFDYNMMATSEVIEKLGKSLRVAAWLKECKLDALANTVAPTNDEIRNVAIQYLAKQPEGKKFLWDVLAGVMSSVDYYQIGFNETVKPIRATLGARFCARATEEANKLLQDRQAAK